MYKRPSGRSFDQLREIKITHNAFGYAPSSVLFELGNTKVLCAVTIQTGVPHFLKGKKRGWLTAEYSMLPTATHLRGNRENSCAKRNDRSIEISRLIGRSLRSMVNLELIGERTIYIDCDVLQADGSTRTACITASCMALKQAVDLWLSEGEISENILTGAVAAISVGLIEGQAILDLDYAEDSMIDADYNFILTDTDHIIEIQGTTEKNLLSWSVFDQMSKFARQGVKELFALSDNKSPIKEKKINKNPGLFSLANRLQV